MYFLMSSLKILLEVLSTSCYNMDQNFEKKESDDQRKSLSIFTKSSLGNQLIKIPSYT